MKIGDIFNAEVKNLPKKPASSHKINKLIHNIPFIVAAGLLFFPFCRFYIVVVDCCCVYTSYDVLRNIFYKIRRK